MILKPTVRLVVQLPGYADDDKGEEEAVGDDAETGERVVRPFFVFHLQGEEPIDETADEHADKETYHDVAKIVDSEVETGPAVEQAPKDEDDGGVALAEDKAEIGGDGHGIAGMAGEEAVFATTVVVDDIDEVHYLWFVGGTEPCDHGLDKC